MTVRQESLFIPFLDGDELHLRHLWKENGSSDRVAFLLHGGIENGRIFYTDSGKGFAPFLAERGWEVYCADLRGHGLSRPPVSARSKYGQTEIICHEIPAFLDFVRTRTGRVPTHWGAHSWGGVLLLSSLARFPEYGRGLKGVTLFAARRTISTHHWKKILLMDLIWKRAAPIVGRVWGYPPFKELGIGPDNDTTRFVEQSSRWFPKESRWMDPEDGFDYSRALGQLQLPTILFLAGASDKALAHPEDIRHFQAEIPATHSEYRLLSRQSGFLHDYGHVDLLTHPDAPRDHFLGIAEWMENQSQWETVSG